MIELENRVDRLEDAMMRTHMMLQGLSMEMNVFKNEIRQDTRDFKRQTQASIDNLNKSLNQKFEKLTKMMGTMVEDMVIPNVEFIAEKYFGLIQGDILAKINIRSKTDRAKSKEFDTLAVYDDKVIWVSAKLTAKPEYAEKFYEEVRDKELFEYLPDYQDKEIIPIFASFHIPDNVMTYLTRHKIYAMASKEDTMDILNYDNVVK
jgi:hypothetical protein